LAGSKLLSGVIIVVVFVLSVLGIIVVVGVVFMVVIAVVVIDFMMVIIPPLFPLFSFFFFSFSSPLFLPSSPPLFFIIRLHYHEKKAVHATIKYGLAPLEVGPEFALN
jgi:hypothetical protein